MHGDSGVRVARRACTKCSRMIIRGWRRERTKREREKERKREKERNSKNI